MELSQVRAAIATVEFDLAENLRIIQFLAEASVAVLDETGCQNNAVGNFKKFFVVIAFGAGYELGSGVCHHF
jgi:hypothetical protein